VDADVPDAEYGSEKRQIWGQKAENMGPKNAGFGAQFRAARGAHQERILIVIKEITAVLIVHTELRTVYSVSCVHQSHHFIRVISLLSFVNTLLCSKKQEESSHNKRTNFFTRETKKFIRWRTASTSIEFGRNNDRVTAST
jgi:hypothetical protein